MISLARQASGRWKVYALSATTEGLNQYLQEKSFPFPTFANPNVDANKAYQLGGTPTTIAIAADGHVQRVWRGAWMGDTKEQIENFFGCVLPGVDAENR